MRSGFNPPVGSSEVPLQFPRAPCVCRRDRARERPREGERSPGSGYRPARPPPRAAECTAGPGSAAAPLRAGPRPRGRGSPERSARRRSWDPAQKFPPNSGPARRRRRRPLQPGAWGRPRRRQGQGQGQGQAGSFVLAGGEQPPGPGPSRSRSGSGSGRSSPAPRLPRLPATWEVALSAAACSLIDSRPPAAACPGRRGAARAPDPEGGRGEAPRDLRRRPASP